MTVLRWASTVAGSWESSLRSAPTRVLAFMAAWRPLPLTSPPTTRIEHGVVFERQDLEEISADAIGGQVSAVEQKTAV